MRYKYSTLTIITILLLLTLQQVVSANEATVNFDHVNVRSGPGTNFDAIGQIHTDETYTITQRENEWVEIEFNSGTGWTHTDFITINENEDTNQSTTSILDDEKRIMIEVDQTHLRNGPSTDYDIIHFVDRGEEFLVLSETGDWYEIENETINGYIHKDLIEKTALSKNRFNDKTIVIDPGHGGRDVGAIGVNGSFEKDLAYKTTTILVRKLEALGAKVVLTRQDDEYISLSSRSSIANNSPADAFISIHFDSVPELPTASGISSYYFHSQDESLADYIQEGIILNTNANDRGAGYGDFQVIRQNYKPSVLLELGFMSNTEEERLLLTDAYQKRIATGIIEGLGKYFDQQ